MKSLLLILRRGLLLAWRHRWTLAVPAVTLLLPATLYALSLPDLYEAKAVVHVSPLSIESIDASLPHETADSSDEVMATVKDRLFTRPILKAVLPILAPDADAEDPAVVESAALAFEWEQVGRSAFTVGLSNPDPEVSARTVNSLLEVFLEFERQDRLARALRNVQFHERELHEAQEEYDGLYDRVSAFRTAHEETLPDRKDAISADIFRMRTDITAQMARAAASRARVQQLEEQILALDTQPIPVSAASGRSVAEDMFALQLGEQQKALNTLEKELAEARAKYQDRHPTVIGLREAVAVHRQAVIETRAALDKERRAAQQHHAGTVDAQRARSRASLLAFQRSANEAAERAEEALKDLEGRIDELHRRLGQIPVTNAALDPLMRDLDLADKRLKSREGAASDARGAADFYERGDTSQVTGYRISARAVPPAKPSGPSRMRYLLTAVGLGLLISYGLILLKNMHEGTTITTADDLKGLFPAAVVVNIPVLGRLRGRSWLWRLRELGLTAYVLLLLGASVYFLAAHKGWIERPDWMGNFFGGSV